MQQTGKSKGPKYLLFFLAAALLVIGLPASFVPAAALQVHWYNGEAETEISVEAGSKFNIGDFISVHSDTVSSTASLGKASYRTQDGRVASVNGKGNLNAKKAGQTDITVTCQGKTLTCHLTVERKGAFGQTTAIKELRSAAKSLAKGMPKKLNAAKAYNLNQKKTNYLESYGAYAVKDFSYDGFLYTDKRSSKDLVPPQRSAQLAVPEAGRYLAAEALLRQFLITNNPVSTGSKRTMRIASVTANSKNGKIMVKLTKKLGAEQIVAAQMAFPDQNGELSGRTRANITVSVYDETDNRFYRGKPVLKKGSRQIEIKLLSFADGRYQNANIEKGHVYMLGPETDWSNGTKVTAK